MTALLLIVAALLYWKGRRDGRRALEREQAAESERIWRAIVAEHELDFFPRSMSCPTRPALSHQLEGTASFARLAEFTGEHA